jgi:serine/threonine-protein kinase HipA
VVNAKHIATLDVRMNGRLVGFLHKLPSGAMTFQYADEWLEISQARPISLSLPLRALAYKGAQIYNFFDNLLPDNERIRARIQAKFKISSSHPFDLLSAIGADCVGAIQLGPEQALSKVDMTTAQALSTAEIAKLLKGYGTDPLGVNEEVEDLRISIAGAQEKTALLWHQEQWCRPIGPTPTSHIFKLPIGSITKNDIDLSESCENEWLCLEIAKAFDFPTAKAKIECFEDVKVLVVERFDRHWSSDGQWLMRLPQEDMCQALGISPNLKYQSDGGPGMAEIMKVLLGAHNANADREQFFRSQILFWLLAATDGHAKNFSIHLEAGGSYSLTPLYDVISFYPYISASKPVQKIKMAMALKGTKRNNYHWSNIQLRHFISTAKAINFSPKKDELILKEMLEKANHVAKEVAGRIPEGFPTHISEPILQGMVSLAKQQLNNIEGGV